MPRTEESDTARESCGSVRRHALRLMLEHRDRTGSLDARALEEIAVLTGLAKVEAYELASFFPALEFDAGGSDAEYEICDDLPCKLRRDPGLNEALALGHLDGVTCAAGPCRGRCAEGSVVTSRRAPARAPVPVFADAAIDLDRYLLAGGYCGLAMARAGTLSSDDILRMASGEDKVRRWGSILVKWPKVSIQARRPIVIVNADEGDPGTFKDLYLLETDPHGVLDGALTCALIMRAERLILYVRHDYASARFRLQQATEELKRHFTLDLPIEIVSSGGAYICGEETALIASLEGQRPVPREQPYSAPEHGLSGQPALVHNVETFYRLRALWGMAPDPSNRTSLLLDPRFEAVSLSGRAAEPGIKIMPFDGSIRDLIATNGGMLGGQPLGGALVGGALGVLLTGALLDLPRAELANRSINFWTPSVVAFSTSDDPREIIRCVARFYARESCGHCTPCRTGTAHATNLLSDRDWDLAKLSDLALVLREASACGFGKAAGRLLETVIGTNVGLRS